MFVGIVMLELVLGMSFTVGRAKDESNLVTNSWIDV